MPGQGFSVTISAVDQLTAPLSAIGKELTQLGRNMRQFQKESTGTTSEQKAGFFERAKDFATKGSREVGKSLREIGREANEAGRKLTEAFEPFAKLGGLGGGLAGGLGLAGLAEGLNRFAESGANLQRTSQRIAVSTRAIEQLGGASKLAGGSTEGMTSALEELGKKLHGAALGVDSEAIGFFHQFHIQVQNSDKSVRSADKAFRDVADALSKLQDPIVRTDAAYRAFGGAAKDIAPVLRLNHDELDRLIADHEKLNPPLIDGGKAATEFEHSTRRLSDAFEGFGKAVAQDVMPRMTPLINEFADWTAEMRKDETAMKAVELGGTALAGVLGVTLVSAVAKLTLSLNSLWLNPAFKFLASPGGLALGAGAALWGLGAFTPPIPHRGKTQADTDLLNAPGPNPGSIGERWQKSKGVMDFLFGGGGSEFTAPIPGAPGAAPPSHGRGMSPPGGTAPGGTLPPPDLGREGWYNNPGNIRTSPAAWQGKGQPYTAGSSGGFETFKTPELGVRAAVKNIQAKLARGITTPAQLAPVLGPASDKNNPTWLAEQYAKALGIGINDPIPNTPEAFNKLIPAITNIEKPYDARSRYTPDVYQRGVASAFDPNSGTQTAQGGWGAIGSALGKVFGIGSAHAAPMPGFGATNFRAREGIDLSAVNPNLVEIARDAAAGLPPGYSVEVTSGARSGGLRGSQHHGGNALDVQLMGPDGPIPNRGEDLTGMYGRYARMALGAQLKMHPELAGKLGWGGNFETSPGSGVRDLMHLDLGGDRGRFGNLGEMGPLYPDKRSDAAPHNALRLAAFDGSMEEGSRSTAAGRGYGGTLIPGTNIPDQGRSEDRILGGKGRPTDRINTPETEDLGLGRGPQNRFPWRDAANLDFLKKGGDRDSEHKVTINVNAPQGTRAQIDEAKGPAKAILRTIYAMT